MSFTNIPNNFSYQEIFSQTITNASNEMKESYCRKGKAPAMPAAIRLLQFYAISENVIPYVPNVDSIRRNTDVPIYLHGLKQLTEPLEESTSRYQSPLGLPKATLDTFTLKDIFSVRVICVLGQIQSTFENVIPAWAQSCGATEAFNCSLALKMTPKHRVRVYQRNEHIIVFTTKVWNDEQADEFLLLRKVWACIPLLRGWVATPELKEEYATLINLHRALIDTNSNNFWNLLEEAYNNNPAINDLKYSGIIQTFNSIKNVRIDRCVRKIEEHRTAAQRLADEYARILEDKRAEERCLLEITQTDTGLDVDAIKRLVDKKICYNLRITNDNKLTYRCSAPLLSYDKAAAKVCYDKRIKDVYSKALEKIFRLLFLDEKVILTFDEAVDINLNQGTIQARSGNTSTYTDLNVYFPNPHHFHYNCWGNYATVITKLIHEYKLEELFYQVKAAIGCFNFTDYPVLSKLIDHLNYIVNGDYNPACFIWRDENCLVMHTLSETLNHFTEEDIE